jgi:hypothetical protein
VAFNFRKIFYPVASDGFAPHTHMKQLADTASTIIPVVNDADRAEVITQMRAAGQEPSFANPVFVFHEELRVVQVTTNGSRWRQVAPFAEYRGRTNFPLATAITHEYILTFPSGHFTFSPVCTGLALVANEITTSINVMAYDVSGTSARIIMHNRNEIPFSSANRVVHFKFEQATAIDTAG